MAMVVVTQCIKHKVKLINIRFDGPRTGTGMAKLASEGVPIFRYSEGISFDKFDYRQLRDERTGKLWLLEVEKGLLKGAAQYINKTLLSDYMRLGEQVFESWRKFYLMRVVDIGDLPDSCRPTQDHVPDADRFYIMKIPLQASKLFRIVPKAKPRQSTTSQESDHAQAENLHRS